MMRFAPGVAIAVFTAPLAELFALCTEWSLLERRDVEINAVDNGTHGAATLHGRSLAADIDTAGDRPEDLLSLARHLARRLGPTWQIIVEATHVHAEYDTGRRLTGTVPARQAPGAGGRRPPERPAPEP
jgi:hypothetical protein